MPAHGLLFRASLVIFSTPCLLYGLCYYSNHVAALYSLYFLFLICFDSPIECCVSRGTIDQKTTEGGVWTIAAAPCFSCLLRSQHWVIFLLCELMDSLSSPLLRRFPWTPSVGCRLWQPTPLSIYTNLRDVFCRSFSAVVSSTEAPDSKKKQLTQQSFLSLKIITRAACLLSNFSNTRYTVGGIVAK